MDENKEFLSSITVSSVEEMHSFASDVASAFVKKAEAPVVFGLRGDLGSGKTTFAQGFAKALGIQEKVLSPTFLIIKKYEIRNTKSETNSKFKIQNSKFSALYHIDCYRLRGRKEIEDLGWNNIISNPKHIVLVEWPERIQEVMPKNTIFIEFESVSEDVRRVSVIS